MAKTAQLSNENRKFQDIVHSIKKDILLGKVAPAEKLPPERVLCERFGVGRGTIREALKTLEAIDLLSIVRGRSGGYYVNRGAYELSKNALTLTIRLERSNIIDSLVFRRMFEPKTCYYAALRRSDQNLRKMEHSIRLMENELLNQESFAQANLEFHVEIGKASRNPYITQFYPHLFEMLTQTSKMVQHLPTQKEVTLFFHKEIFEKIKHGKAEKAETLMDAHLSYILNDMQQAKELGTKLN